MKTRCRFGARTWLFVTTLAFLMTLWNAHATTHIVTFVCCEYTPSNFQAAVGDTVEWQGNFAAHPLQSTTIPPGAAPFSNSTGSSFSYVIQIQGTYNYHCTVHTPSMSGSFDVQAGGLVGTKTIPGDYATIRAAIADLNTQGVGTGGVTFNVAAGHTETASNLVIAIPTNRPTAGNRVAFQKSGTGSNPLITAAPGVSATLDGVIRFVGADYLTFDGIDLLDPPSNTGNAMMEWGYALLRASATDGSQNNVIKNCVITLQKINTNSIGIYVANRDTSGTTVNWTDTLGQNSRNKFFGNTISNVYRGISLISSSTARDENNEVGVTSESPNSVTNWGGSNVATDAIRCEGQVNVKINNNVVNGGGGTTEFVNGIIATLFGATGVAPNYEISHNIVTVSGAHTTRLMYGIRALATGDTVRVHHNVVENCTYPTATSAPFHGIALESTGSSNVGFVHDNIVRNNTLPGTGLMSGITATGTYGELIIHSNEVYGNQKTGASGNLYGIQTGQAAVECYSNSVYNNTIPSSSGTSAASLYAYSNTNSSVVAQSIYDNSFFNLSVGGTSTSTASVIYAIYAVPGLSSNASTKNIRGNTIYGLSSSVGTVAAIFQQYGSTVHIHKNNIYNLSTGASSTTNYAAGIIIAGALTGAGPVTKVYNNLVSDIRAPNSNNPNGVIGINSTLSAGGTSTEVYYNTIYLDAASSGTNFGTSGISTVGNATATTASLDLRNNIIVNVSTPNGSGLTTVLRRTNTNLANYSSGSNNNDLYAGSPAANRLIFFDGTNSDQTLSAYKARVAPRDSASISVIPPFENVATMPYDLHIDPTVATPIDSGGTPVAGIAEDFDGDSRDAVYPDIGADEFAHTITPLPSAPQLVSPEHNAIVNADSVLCVWTSSTPAVTRYWFERSTDSLFTTNLVVDSTLTDTSTVTRQLTPNTTYWWRVRAMNVAGWGEFSAARSFAVVIVGAGEKPTFPGVFKLSQNYPNPFNPSTQIRYTLPKKSFVTLKVYNVLGQEVITLVNEEQEAGYVTLTWNGRSSLGHAVGSGLYFYRIEARPTDAGGTFTQTKKMLMMK